MLAIAVATVILARGQQSMIHDLRVALAHETIGSKHFRKVMDGVLKEDGASVPEDDDLLMTLGDTRGCVVRTRINSKSEGDPPNRECLFFWPKFGITHVQLIQGALLDQGDFFLFGETYWRADRLEMCGAGNSGGNFNWGWIRSYRFSH